MTYHGACNEDARQEAWQKLQGALAKILRQGRASCQDNEALVHTALTPSSGWLHVSPKVHLRDHVFYVESAAPEKYAHENRSASVQSSLFPSLTEKPHWSLTSSRQTLLPFCHSGICLCPLIVVARIGVFRTLCLARPRHVVVEVGGNVADAISKGPPRGV